MCFSSSFPNIFLSELFSYLAKNGLAVHANGLMIYLLFLVKLSLESTKLNSDCEEIKELTARAAFLPLSKVTTL